MAKKLHSMQEEKCDLEMTPMIDVTFLLLIFFMCTLKFKTLEGKLAAYLPKDVGVNQTQAEPIEKVDITLRVRSTGNKLDPFSFEPKTGPGRFVFDGSRVIEYSVGPFKTTKVGELLSRLKALRKQDEERPATIDAMPGTVYGDVVPVLDAALEAGFEEITFVGARDAKQGG